MGLRRFYILGFLFIFCSLANADARPCRDIFNKLSPGAKSVLSQHGNKTDVLYFRINRGPESELLGDYTFEFVHKAYALSLTVGMILIRDESYLVLSGRVSNLRRFAAEPGVLRVVAREPHWSQFVQSKGEIVPDTGSSIFFEPPQGDPGYGAGRLALQEVPSFGGGPAPLDSGNIDSLSADLH